jgi:hydrogenase maturation factor HypF (carbamoyltransferase family)
MHTFTCPDCGHEHQDPADARFVLTVRCTGCELEAGLIEVAERRSREAERRIPAAA